MGDDGRTGTGATGSEGHLSGKGVGLGGGWGRDGERLRVPCLGRKRTFLLGLTSRHRGGWSTSLYGAGCPG